MITRDQSNPCQALRHVFIHQMLDVILLDFHSLLVEHSLLNFNIQLESLYFSCHNSEIYHSALVAISVTCMDKKSNCRAADLDLW